MNFLKRLWSSYWESLLTFVQVLLWTFVFVMALLAVNVFLTSITTPLI